MPKIQITTPEGATYTFDLDDRARVGRAEDNDFVVPEGSVSSYHGEFLSKGDSLEIHDLGSTNGTHVDGQRVESAVIAPGGLFRLGNCHGTVLVEVDESAADEPASYEEEAAAPARSSGSSYSQQESSAVITGLGATACPSNQRVGFGAKSKPKGSGGGLVMLLGVLSLIASAAAIFLILQMGA